MHALVPRLGLFQDDLSQIPYDYQDILRAIAPRPTLLFTPTSDRDATWVDVSACVNASASAWGHDVGALTHLAPDAISKMEMVEAKILDTWLKTVV